MYGVHSLVLVVGVGSKNPETVASMWGGGVRRSETYPLRIIPDFGKVAQDHVEPAKP
jgi:hypothetical protein